VKPETAAKLIDKVYDCVLQPSEWPEFLKLISAKGENAGSAIVVHEHSDKRTRLFEHGADQSHLRIYFEKLASMKMMPSGRPHLRTLGDITTMTMLCGEQESLEREFFVRWIQPSGFRDMIGVLVLKSGRRLAWFSIARNQIQPRYGEADIQFMDSLSPHICRAFMMADIFDLQSVRIQQLEQVVNALPTAVFLTDHHGISYMNRSAEDLIERGGSLKVKNNHLITDQPGTADRLSHAVSASLKGVAPAKIGSHQVPIPDQEEGGHIASVLPLKWHDANHPLMYMPGSAAILVQDKAQPTQFAGPAFAELYGLTPAELRISLEIARGLTPQEISQVLTISTNTIKTHLQRVFAKTGVTRQADLIRLIMQMTPPVRMPDHPSES